jgi:hypothetical protein
MGVSVVGSHFVLLVLKIKFVVEEVLIVSQVLHGPSIFFSILVLSIDSVFFNLLGSFSVDLCHLVGSEILEVVWDVSMWSQLGLSGSSIFRHDITHVGSGDFKLVLAFLVIFPVLLPLFLFVGLSLIIFLQFLELLFFLHGHLVLEHASHSGEVFGLLCVFFFLSLFVVVDPLVFSLLLFNPFFLDGSVLLFSVAESCNNKQTN